MARKQSNKVASRGGTPLQEPNGDVPLDDMGSHFHNWSDYYGVAFLIELLEWGCKFSNFGGKLGIKMGRFSVKKIRKLFIKFNNKLA